MEKEELIEQVNIFLKQSLNAHWNFSILEQLSDSKKNYIDEMSVSSAFYSLTYSALQTTVFMDLSKIYDTHHHSTNIEKLFYMCKKYIEYFPTHRAINLDENNCRLEFPFQHTITEKDKIFFQNDIENMKFEQSLSDKIPLTIDMSKEKYFDLYEWRLDRVKPRIKNLIKQRNKIYAHNDLDTILSVEKVMSEFPVYYEDISSLIEFSLDFTTFAYAMLTNIQRSSEPLNLNDLENTLDLVKKGMKYQDQEVKRQLEEFKNIKN
ncbi:hypothetical protein [Enterococcus lactis]|uniref:AbiU2 domain-containing protein n=1 Tax=Enterococcus lactis TaxID=357441 RepID=UPI00237A9CDA|nr:hypothetical protein [Enterococcus lactis]